MKNYFVFGLIFCVMFSNSISLAEINKKKAFIIGGSLLFIATAGVGGYLGFKKYTDRQEQERQQLLKFSLDKHKNQDEKNKDSCDRQGVNQDIKKIPSRKNSLNKQGKQDEQQQILYPLKNPLEQNRNFNQEGGGDQYQHNPQQEENDRNNEKNYDITFFNKRQPGNQQKFQQFQQPNQQQLFPQEPLQEEPKKNLLEEMLKQKNIEMQIGKIEGFVKNFLESKEQNMHNSAFLKQQNCEVFISKSDITENKLKEDVQRVLNRGNEGQQEKILVFSVTTTEENFVVKVFPN